MIFLRVFNIIVFSLVIGIHNVSASEDQVNIPIDQRRSVEQTFLTYPEWFLVHSPAEYAEFVKLHPSHEFPFLGHINQLWSAYRAVTKEQIQNGYDANIGYHVMICVIVTSTTVEYVFRWVYENTIGRISWALSSEVQTDEEHYGAKIAQEYVDFIRKEPWYLFDFSSALTGLWTDTRLSGVNIIRKLERKYALSTEYLIKAGYAKLIEVATHQAYEPALLTTLVIVDHLPKELPKNVKLLKGETSGAALLELPRYYNFRIAATELAETGSKIQNVAGNTTKILVTVWTDGTYQAPIGSRILFEQPILTQPRFKRVALIMPVQALSEFLMQSKKTHLKVEHIYDY
ncbi:hypothetical protein INP77_11160 [Methylophilus sp. 13]|uniref:hypothetical protein n=1 Tax=Methylophilus sp. 13 TaxID=2781018 RepID=UPI00188EE7E0|nr:hypothetical protein [Methylophilus sp. 13]MBF5040046.1 hypothetical protein [Methylophilus sp. 13]